MIQTIQTEYEFTLPIGFHDGNGNLLRQGVMRLATAADEISPLRDGRVQANPAYLIVILLSRVIKRLGSMEYIPTNIVEGLYAADLAYLQNLYNEINQVDQDRLTATCPKCHHAFEIERPMLGGL